MRACLNPQDERVFTRLVMLHPLPRPHAPELSMHSIVAGRSIPILQEDHALISHSHDAPMGVVGSVHIRAVMASEHIVFILGPQPFSVALFDVALYLVATVSYCRLHNASSWLPSGSGLEPTRCLSYAPTV
jgi:hypothetical protein